ncbi:MAG TPA: outer membrane beta-barrel protein [Candidatus Acidoferrales bacterium]|nr:outer membrane beta-barrel protein [Candidatus Acidoferrales bacterium]
MSKVIIRILPLLLVLMFGGAGLASAQGFSAYIGLGTAQDSSSNQGIDTYGDGNIYYTPRMGGVFMNLGGDFMFFPHLGVGAETSFRVTQGGYAGLNYRPVMYDFNAVWEPVAVTSRVVPEIQGGIGGVDTRFYYNSQYCDQFTGCSSSNSYLESSNHFDVHFAAGVRFYVKNGIFVEPRVDLRYVHNFFQFGSDFVPEYTVNVGYTFGRH